MLADRAQVHGKAGGVSKFFAAKIEPTSQMSVRRHIGVDPILSEYVRQFVPAAFQVQ